MIRTVTLSFDQRVDSTGTCKVVELHLDGIDYESDRLCFEFVHVDEHRLVEPEVLDGYLFMFILFAMRHADRLVVEGPLTAAALRNVQTFMEAWRAWLPSDYAIVAVEPDSVVSDVDVSRRRVARMINGRAISAFSGGIDAIFTMLRHGGSAGEASRYDLTDVLIVHGLDVPSGEQREFDLLVERVMPLVDSIGLSLRVLRMNTRRRLAREWEVLNWGHSFGAQVAGALHHFSDEFEYGLIGSSEPYTHPVTARGSTPATDYLLSGGFMSIVHDGAGFSRTEKVEQIAVTELGRRVAKVCWEGPSASSNCGTCEKCVRTRLNFLAVGLESPECFDTPFDLCLIDRLVTESEVPLLELRTIVEYAERRGNSAAWVQRLRDRCEYLTRSAARQ